MKYRRGKIWDVLHTFELKNLFYGPWDHSSKTTLITSSVSGTGVNPPFCNLDRFFLGPWLEVCQFLEIFNQMESNGEVSNVG